MNRQQRRQEEWIQNSIRLHKDWMKKTNEPVPTWLIIRTVNFEKALGKQSTIPCLIGDCGEESANKFAKKLIDKYDPDVWVFFSEGWAKILGDDFDDFMKTRKRGDIEKLPDKLEGLNIVAKNRDNTLEISEQYWIIRDKDKKIIDFKPTAVGKEAYVTTSYLNENPKNPVNERFLEAKS
jgi:ribosomal protein L39E